MRTKIIFRLVGAWIDDRRGVAAIEFAIALPFLIVLIVGTFELGGLLLTQMLMEGAVRDASRLGITGYKPDGKSREELILETIDSRTLNLVDIDKAVVNELVYQKFADIGKPEPLTTDVNGNGAYDAGDGDEYVDINGNGNWDTDMGAAGLGGPGDVVVYTVTYDYPSFTGLLTPLFGDDGTITLRASTAIRNEPFNLASGS